MLDESLEEKEVIVVVWLRKKLWKRGRRVVMRGRDGEKEESGEKKK